MRLLLILSLISFSLFAVEKISLQLKWHHQFQFAGYYAALEKGFFGVMKKTRG
jgi:ABC-type nitrate/sulfonate/bicarbonate transport system substrate-binding protein